MMIRFKQSGEAAAVSLLLAAASQSALAQAAEIAQAPEALPTITVNGASADASKQGLSPAYPGGQVARGGRAGILGTKDNLSTPFSITAYTNKLIQDKQARSVGDVLQNDPSVRMARGFGNFQEAYYIRGFILHSDAVAYNGLYSLLPRQYIATELFERVEVLRGASAFLNGAAPSTNGAGLGGSINLLPKRAGNEDLNRVTVGAGSGSQFSASADLSRRFGPDKATGLRLNVAHHDGGSAIDEEKSKLSVASLGADWHSRNVRLSGDIGYQDHKLDRTRSNVAIFLVNSLPALPDNATNASQPWAYSNERDLFGTFRAEVDLSDHVTAWGAYGLRRTDEANSLANFTLSNAATGDGSTYRFDNTRKDAVDTVETGVRGKFRTGSVGHEWVVSGSYFKLDSKNAYRFDAGNPQLTNLYNPVRLAVQPAWSGTSVGNNNLAAPGLTESTELTSFALGDTLSVLDDSLLLTLGARYQRLNFNSFLFDSSYDDSRVSPLLGVVYKLSKGVSLYGNHVEGLTQGDKAPAAASNGGTSLSPYASKQKEIGVKYDAGRLGLGLAYFTTDKPRGVGGSTGTPFTSSGKDEHQGLEFTAHGEATRGLRVLGGVTWLDAKQKQTGTPANDGKRTIGIPELQANVGAEWEVPGASGLALDGRVVYTGSVYADNLNTIEVPSWTRVDVGVRYLFDLQNMPVTLRARVENVGDRKYWASSGGYPNNGYLVIGAPRTFALSASVDF